MQVMGWTGTLDDGWCWGGHWTVQVMGWTGTLDDGWCWGGHWTVQVMGWTGTVGGASERSCGKQGLQNIASA